MPNDDKPTGVQLQILKYLHENQHRTINYLTFAVETLLYVQRSYPDVTPAEMATATMELIDKGLIGGTGFLFEEHK